MLHEILLSLSGVPSPIWENLRIGKVLGEEQQSQDDSLGALTSPAEKAMVGVLAELANLHIKVRDATSTICTSHSSPICRAVANRIKTYHLRAFVNKIIQVETSILDQDAAYVGAYKIVPLSTIVSDFQPWARPLQWLWKIVRPLQQIRSGNLPACSGAALLRSLHSETRTGYVDLRALCEDLLVVAQRSWLHNLMPWLLYGQLPSFGASDFMVQVDGSGADYRLQHDHVPYFVTPTAAETILSIGLALQQITPKTGSSQKTLGLTKTCTALMPDSLREIQSLQYPLQDTDVSNVVDIINDAISQAALSVILPTSVILDFLIILQEYILLRNGEFSTCLIQQIEEYLVSHRTVSSTSRPVRKLGKVEDLNLNESETSTILDKTWSELSAFVPEEDSEISLRDKAAELLRLRQPPSALPVNSLLPNSASLIVQLPSDSPLSIFTSALDIDAYRVLSAYLASIRRAEFKLAKLWREPALRRCYPTPLGPPRSTTDQGRQTLATRRNREHLRNASMRQHWASISQVLFLMSELGGYFYGEVMQNSWTLLHTWLLQDHNSRPTSSKISSRPATSSSARSAAYNLQNTSTTLPPRRNDPRTIALAHRKYLSALHHSLLLGNHSYTSCLSTLLTQIDHYVALFHRLQAIWSSLDLEADSSISNILTNHKKEETDLMAELARTNTNVTETVHDLVNAMREIEKQRDMTDLSSGVAQVNMSSGARGDTFEPWKARTLDRLLMKLDSLAATSDDRSEQFEDALVDLDDA